MRATPYGPCWPSSCAICEWEVVCPCCGGRLFSVRVGVFSRGKGGGTFGFVRVLVLRLRNKRHGDAIRAIRSDNGSEFRNSRLETFCHDLGLEHQISSPYTPPQNGVVKRKNRTLCEMARTMLDEHRTLRRFWDEAMNTACYVSNRIYLRVHKKKTCYELMHGRTPKVSHFHVFWLQVLF
jgi:transposase InsO family protein